jgi:hypothetical protein
MSPLWPDFALACAAWSNAVKSGLVDDDEPRGGTSRRDVKRSDERKPRRVPRRLVSSYAL